MKMGEIPKFNSESKDFKKFETPKTRAQQEAKKNALKMEGGSGADNPSGSASSNSYDDFFDALVGGGNTGNTSNTEEEIDALSLPGALLSDESDKFETPTEEIAALKKEIELHTSFFDDKDAETRAASKALSTYKSLPANEVLTDEFMQEGRGILEKLNLEIDKHDKKIEELLGRIPEAGVKNTIDMVSKLNNPHLEDDFHRALVAYITEGLPAPLIDQVKHKSSLNLSLYEVNLGIENPTEQEQGLQQQKVRDLDRLLKTMEQFYFGMLSVTGSGNIFAVEIAKPIDREDVVFYVAVPKDKRDLFESHLTSVYPDAKLHLKRNDYNIFNYSGSHKGVTLSLDKHYSAPLKTYESFTHDPLNIILGAFSGLEKGKEGASIQFVIGDDGSKHNDFVQKVVTNMRKNKSFKKAVAYAESHVNVAKDELKKAFKEMIFGKDDSKPDPIDEALLENVIKKTTSRIVPVNLRILASSDSEARSGAILDNLISTFNQFENPRVNRFKVARPKKLNELIHNYIYRNFNPQEKILLNLTELSTIVHLTAAGVRTSRELKQSRFKHVQAPIDISEAKTEKGIVLGVNKYGAKNTEVKFLEADRMRHFYEIGQTGTGKTYLMKSMIIQDILNGEGVCYIDPHGTDIVDILASIPPERADDVIYFDPAYVKRPYGLNILEWDENYPEQKTFVTDELYEIFVKLFGDVPESLGPMFQQYYRNATLLALEGLPAGKATIADIPKVFANSDFRHKLLSRSKNPIVNQFWLDIAEKAGGDASLENVTPYITAKTDTFLSNEIMRPIIAQEKSTMDFKQIMNERKILLVNLSKGRIGELNAQLLGLIVVGKFLQSALSRVDTLDVDSLAPFYLYIDEFQNFTTPSIATILSEARKYKLSLNLAHQFIKQLDEKIRDAVFGNVGTKCVFRVAPEDAEFLEKTFAPDVLAKDLTSIENYNAYLSLLVKGTPVKPFNIQTIYRDFKPDYEYAEKLRQLSYLKYGRERNVLEEEIFKKYMPKPSEDRPKPQMPWM